MGDPRLNFKKKQKTRWAAQANKKPRRKYGAGQLKQPVETGDLTNLQGPLAYHTDRASGHTTERQVSMKNLAGGRPRAKLLTSISLW